MNGKHPAVVSSSGDEDPQDTLSLGIDRDTCAAPLESTDEHPGEIKVTQSRLVREGVWVVGGRALGIGTAIGINVLLARVLPPSDVGVFFLLATIITFFSLIAMLGLNTGLVRFVSESVGLRDAPRARRVLWQGAKLTTIAISLGGVICFLFLWFFGETLFELKQVEVLAPLVALCVMAFAAIQLTASLLRSFYDSRLSIMLTGQLGGPISNLVVGGLTIGLYLYGVPRLGHVMCFVCLSMCLLAPLAVFCLVKIGRYRLANLEMGPEPHTPDEDRNEFPMATLIAVCIPLTLTQCLSYVTGQADIWIAGATVQHEDLALYGASRRLMLLIGMPMQLVNLTVIASIAELHAQGRLKDLQNILRTASTLAAVPAFLVCIPLLLFPAQVSTLVYGPFYAEGAMVLRILSVGAIVFAAVGAAELTLMMSGHHKRALAVNIITSITLFTCGVPMCRLWGITGMAVAWAVVVSLQCILFCLFARQSLGIWTGMDLAILWRWRDITALIQSKRSGGDGKGLL